MADTGWLDAGTIVSGLTGDASWSTPTNAQFSSNSYAETAALATSQTTEHLIANH
jgi:hypothetical protein